MCSVVKNLGCDLFKEYNIKSITLRSHGHYYIVAELMHDSGQQELMLIKKHRNYKDSLMSALQALYLYFGRK